MTNQQIAQQIAEIGEMLEILNGNSFKIIAYEKAARMIEMNSLSVEDIYKTQGIKGLEEIQGVGESIAEKIKELIETGKIKYHQELQKKVPRAIIKFTKIPGVGPKTAKKLYDVFRVNSIKDLEKVLKTNKKIEIIQLKTRENILRGIDILSKQSGRMLLSYAEPMAREAIEILKKYPEIKNVNAVGSLRRMKETVGDIDIVVATQQKLKINEIIIDKFIKESFVKKVISKGNTKASIINQQNIEVDLEILPAENYGSLLQHFTGSKDHNIALRTYAEKQGLSLSEYGIKKLLLRHPERSEGSRDSSATPQNDNRVIQCKNEEEFYKNLKMQTPPPELRENLGEIELALQYKLPKLVELADIKGDLQMHSQYSDGQSTIEEMAKYCKSRGYKYMAITDHPYTLGITQGLKEKTVDKYIKEIRAVSKKIGIHIFAGIEADIKPNGDIDLPDSMLKKFDIVLAAIHTSFRQDKETTTKRYLKAMDNKFVKIIVHPTGRLINRRPGVEADWDKIFLKAKEKNIAMEINAYPDRLDLNDVMTKRAIELGVKLFINTDSHQVKHLENMRYGVAQARRGWATKQDILNTKSLEEIRKYFHLDF